MFFKRKSGGHNRQLDDKLQRIQMNFENNYKDAAQDALKEFEVKLNEMLESGMLSDKQRLNYEIKLYGYKTKLKGFTHKDQKATWT